MNLIEFIILGLACGAIALTITKGSVFQSLRNKIEDKSKFFGDLVNCPYCTSHWVAMGAMLAFRPKMLSSSWVVFNYLGTWFALVSLSAVTAGVIFGLFSAAKKNNQG